MFVVTSVTDRMPIADFQLPIGHNDDGKDRTAAEAHYAVCPSSGSTLSLSPSSAEAREVGQQLLRSGTSEAANYRAVCKARSRADFISKLGIVEEEVDESVFWLEFLVESQLMPPRRMTDLIGEAKQLTAIFGASRKTAKENNRQSELGNRKSRGKARHD